MAQDLIGMTVNGYEIVSQIGQGGMAAVFLARQQSMNRHAALKFLPIRFMNNDTYLQRFEREVKIVSQLEHRNIVPVYDYGEHQGQPYIVMRYMPAGSVEDLLRQGRIPLQRILSIVEQVAAALDYAHQKGILHRDLKPSNVLLDDGGGVFITDFGIARILSEGHSAITTQGVVGTPSYMSPEQAQAHELDGRSDAYSLGVMLFEMVTGRRPFESDTPYSVAVMQVTAAPPSPRELDGKISPAVDRMILRSLHKDPDQRYKQAGELARALRRAIEQPEGIHDTEPNLQPPAALSEPQQFVPSTAPRNSQTPPPPTLHSISLPFKIEEGQQKPSGRRLWLAAGWVAGCVLLAGLIAAAAFLFGSLPESSQGDARPVSRTSTVAETAPRPTVAPSTMDFTRLTLAALNEAADGTLAADALTRAARPAADLLAAPTLKAALKSAAGRLVYFDSRGARDAFEIVTLDLESREVRQLTALGPGVNTYPQPSPDGRWLAFQSDRDGDFEIYAVNALGGQLRQITNNRVWDRLPAWSPDGEWIVYSSDVRGDETFDLYRVRADGSDNQVVHSDGWRNSHARYSPDGDYLVFTAGSDVRDARSWEIRLLDLRTQETRLLTENAVRDASPSFSPDGQRILFVTSTGDNRVLASMTRAGSEPRILYAGPGNVWSASFSPDGNFILVTATYQGEDQLFLMEADGGNVQQITVNGGAYASWIPQIAFGA